MRKNGGDGAQGRGGPCIPDLAVFGHDLPLTEGRETQKGQKREVGWWLGSGEGLGSG